MEENCSWILIEIYSDSAPSDKTCREWFWRFKNGDFDVEDKERSGRSAKSIWRWRITGIGGWRPISNAKTTCRSVKLCSICYFWSFENLGKGLTRKENGSHMNWSQETLKGEKPSAKFCLLGNKERGFCTELWLAMKSGSISITPNAEKPCAIQINHRHQRQSGISTERR